MIVVNRPSVQARTDEELLDGFRRGDMEAFGDLYSRYFEVARRIACASRARDPENLAGQAFLKILGAVSRGSGPTTNFRAYVATTVRALVAVEARRPEVPVADLESWAPDLARAPSPLDLLIDSEERALVWTALAALPPAARELLVRVELHEETPRALAAEVDISPNTVACRAQRARKQMKQVLRALEAPEQDKESHSGTNGNGPATAQARSRDRRAHARRPAAERV